MYKIYLKITGYFRQINHKNRLNAIRHYGISKKSVISYDFQISNPENVTIDDYVYIGPRSFLSCYGKIHLKKGVIIGPNIIIHTANHNYAEDIKSIPYDEKLIIKDVIIHENVWIGDRVIIMPGVEIGEGSIIAAGSVIIKNIPPFSIAGGNPARVIRQRDNIDDYLRLKKEGKIYLKIKNGD